MSIIKRKQSQEKKRQTSKGCLRNKCQIPKKYWRLNAFNAMQFTISVQGKVITTNILKAFNTRQFNISVPRGKN